MTEMTFREIGDRLASAFRLAARPLAVYGTDTRPADAVHLAEVNRCLAVSMFRMATDNPADAVYLTGGEQEGCCLGGLTHMGFIAPPEHIRYFVSTGRADIMNGAAEYPESDARTGRAIPGGGRDDHSAGEVPGHPVLRLAPGQGSRGPVDLLLRDRGADPEHGGPGPFRQG